MWLKSESRSDREQVMERSAATYLDRLQAMVKSHPEQWQIFGGFFLPDR